MARMRFSSVFIQHPNGMLEPTMRVKIGGVIFGPGAGFGQGASFSGINVFEYIGCDIEAKEENGGIVIEGFYK